MENQDKCRAGTHEGLFQVAIEDNEPGLAAANSADWMKNNDEVF